MFGMGFTEILLIAIVAILFLGPDKLPDAMVQIGKFLNSFRKTINEAKSSFEEELHIKELREEALNYRKTLQETTSDISGFKNAVPNPAKELEEALDEARSGLGDMNDPSKLYDDWEEEEEKPHDMVTEYKAMAQKALEESHASENPSAGETETPSDAKEPTAAEKGEGLAEADSPAKGFKNLDGDKAEN
jgi:sec-independent protein translocase protein TatB